MKLGICVSCFNPYACYLGGNCGEGVVHHKVSANQPENDIIEAHMISEDDPWRHVDAPEF